MRRQQVFVLGFSILALAFSPALASTLRADDTPSQRPKADGEKPRQAGAVGFLVRFRAAIDKLSLTEDQKPKVDAAFSEAKVKIEAIVKDSAGDREAIRGKVQPIVKELTEKVVALLTPEQKEQFEKARSAARKAQGDGTQPRTPRNQN